MKTRNILLALLTLAALAHIPGCAVLTIDVDVFKSPLPTEESAQTPPTPDHTPSPQYRKPTEQASAAHDSLLSALKATDTKDAKLRAQLDRQFWQNINQIRISAHNSDNYLIAKDDIGNWYVKNVSDHLTPVPSTTRPAQLISILTLYTQTTRGQAKSLQKNAGQIRDDIAQSLPPNLRSQILTSSDPLLKSAQDSLAKAADDQTPIQDVDSNLADALEKLLNYQKAILGQLDEIPQSETARKVVTNRIGSTVNNTINQRLHTLETHQTSLQLALQPTVIATPH